METSGRLRLFALYVFLLSIPFWIAGFMIGGSFLPGVPISAAAVVVPTIAASIVVVQAGRWARFRQLIGRVGDFRTLSPGGWIAAISLPIVMVGAEWTWRSLTGLPPIFILSPQAMISVAMLMVVAAILEEIGWTGFATDLLTQRFGPVVGGLVLGCGWAVWHYPALLEANRSIGWIVWWSIWTIGQRVAMVGLYHRTGRNFAAPVCFHTTANVLWQAAPDAFNPAVEALAIVVISGAVSRWPLSRPWR